MRHVLAVLFFLCSAVYSPSVFAICYAPHAHNLQIDGTKRLSTDSTDIVALFGWAQNCLTSPHFQVLNLQFQNAETQGMKFCKSGLATFPNSAIWIPVYANVTEFNKHRGKHGRIWGAYYESDPTSPGSNLYIDNEMGDEWQWGLKVYTGYYQLKSGNNDSDAMAQCRKFVDELVSSTHTLP